VAVPDRNVIFPKHEIVIFIGHAGLLSGSPDLDEGFARASKREGNMRFKSISSAALTAAAFLLLGTQAKADDTNKYSAYSASYSGFQEVGALNAETGAILSPAQGNLTLNVDKANQFINFQLTYSGSLTNVLQSHIHFGKEHVPGGVMVFFCANPSTTPPVVKPPPPPAPMPQPCPLAGGTVTGTWTKLDVVGPTGQNVPAGDFDALLAALRSNTASLLSG
jgi:hypothetical protein